ncbi:MAG TPA: hypothetical protein VII93_01275 [Anaerolineales bacterium]
MSENKVTEVKTTQREPGQDRRVFTFKVTQLIWLVLIILETMIALRFGLKLIAANPDSPIVGFIYGFTNLFLLPFTGMTAQPSASGMVLELSSLFAMVIYGLIGWGIERIVWLIFYRPQEKTESVTQSSSSDHRTP